MTVHVLVRGPRGGAIGDDDGTDERDNGIDAESDTAGAMAAATARAVAHARAALEDVQRQTDQAQLVSDMKSAIADAEDMLEASSGESEYHSDMATDITRPELDAKLELYETRMDKRVGEFIGRVELRDAKWDARLDAMQTEARSTSEYLKGMKSAIILTGVTVVLGVGAIALAMQANMIASFESGRNTAQMISATDDRVIEAFAKRVELAAVAKASAGASAAVGKPPTGPLGGKGNVLESTPGIVSGGAGSR